MSINVRPLGRDPNGQLLQNWGTQLATFQKTVSEAGIELSFPVDMKELQIIPPASTTTWALKGVSGGTGEAYVPLTGPIAISLISEADTKIADIKTASGLGSLTFSFLLTR